MDFLRNILLSLSCSFRYEKSQYIFGMYCIMFYAYVHITKFLFFKKR